MYCFFFHGTATTEIYTLSYTTLFRSLVAAVSDRQPPMWVVDDAQWLDRSSTQAIAFVDRKSTRLNSSHSSISYAVFCLKKKNYRNMQTPCTSQLHSSSALVQP